MVSTLSILGLWASLYPVQNTASWLLNSSGAPGTLAKINGALYIPYVAGLVVAAKGPGIEAVAWVVVGYSVVSLGVVWLACRARVGVRVMDQVRAIWPAVLACIPAWGAGYAVAQRGVPGVLSCGAGVGRLRIGQALGRPDSPDVRPMRERRR
jgi:hypothetical protein